MGGKGGKTHHIPLGRPHGVKQGGAWGKERDLPYEASAGEPSEESAEAIVPERGRAEPNNRQSTNGSRKPHPDGKRREIGIRAERRKRQTHEPSRRGPKRSEHRKSHQGRHGQQGRPRSGRDENRTASGAFRDAWKGNPEPDLRTHTGQAEGDTQAQRWSEEARNPDGKGQGDTAGDSAGNVPQGRHFLLGILVWVQAKPQCPNGNCEMS